MVAIICVSHRNKLDPLISRYRGSPHMEDPLALQKMDTYHLALSTFINTLKYVMIERQRYWIPRGNSTSLMQHASLQEATIRSN